MQPTVINAQIHRFRDNVAMYLGDGSTVYLKPADARKLARAINKAARSCETERFTNSSGNTAQFTFDGER